jgi:uncharacterized delta-60 repeat protein
MVSEYSKINLSRYCSLRQLSTNELEGVLQNGESTLYVNEDNCLCLISKNSDVISIQRLLNQINNVKIPEFTLPDFIDEYTAYALSAVKNGSSYDLSWAKIPTALDYSGGGSSLPTFTGSTKYRSIITDNLQKVNLTNQSVINQLNNYDLNVFLNEGDSTLHIENNDLYLSEKTPTGITTNIFKNNSINNLTPLNFPQTQLTGNDVYCLSSKTVSGVTTLDWLLVNAKLNYNTGNTITVNEIIDIVDINKTKINLSKQSILNPTGLTNNDIIDIIKKRNNYNEFILHKNNNNLILSTKNYDLDLIGDYYTIKNTTLSNNNIYGKEIPNFDQSTEEDYILVFLYTGDTSTNTIDDWELSWIPVTPQLSYSFQLNNTITTGDIDNTFNIGTGFNGYVKTITLQPDGKILVGGSFSTYSGVTSNKIIRLNTGGTIDNTFTIGTGFTGEVNTIVLQPDGKILVGGDFTSYSGVTKNNIIRLNNDGTIDNTFTVGDGFNGFVQTITLQPDGKILIGGYFTSYSIFTPSINSNYIIRLNTGGTIDDTFTVGNGFDNPVNIITLQPDGKILVGGDFSTYSGVTSNKIIRLNTGGTIDNTFTIGTGFTGSSIYSIELQPDGKILAGGSFTSYSGVTSNGIIRLNTGGTIDNTFNIGDGFNGDVFSIELQPDGKILVGGSFSTYSGVTSNCIVRLNTNGTIDNNTTFNVSGGFFGDPIIGTNIYTITLQKNGKILVGGDFTEYNTLNFNKIIRLDMNQNATLNIYKNNVLVANTSTNGTGNVLLSNDDNFYGEVIIDNFLSSNQLNTIINGNVSPYAEQIPIINLTGTITSSTFIAKNSNRYLIELNTI